MSDRWVDDDPVFTSYVNEKVRPYGWGAWLTKGGNCLTCCIYCNTATTMKVCLSCGDHRLRSCATCIKETVRKPPCFFPKIKSAGKT